MFICPKCIFLSFINKKYQTFGLGQEWKGGDVNLFAGGGQKVNILLKELEKYKSNEKQIILFTDR